ncbi:MAG: glycosyltransferase [Evtepia sp.]
MPEISVIVPVYKAETLLRSCVNSVLAQSFVDWELILIEDGSPDESGALCDMLASKEPRIRVFHKKNGGVSSARNRGMQEAQGRYLAFLDADDWFAPEALQTLYDLAEKNDADTAGCAHYRAEVNGETSREAGALPPGVYDEMQIRSRIVSRLLGERLGKQEELLNGFVWRFLFTKDLISRGNLSFLGAYLEDELFLLEYFCVAKKLAMTDEPLYYYLQNPASVTRRYLSDYWQTFTRFLKEKEMVAQKYELGLDQPDWKENSVWSGVLIAVGNEFAPGNTASFSEKRRRIRALSQYPEVARAVAVIAPKNLSRNKQMVADLFRKRRFSLLAMMYFVKNRKRV